MVIVHDSQCEKPGCTKNGVRTYRNGDGNTLQLCREHYYRLVAEDGSGTVEAFESDPETWLSNR